MSYGLSFKNNTSQIVADDTFSAFGLHWEGSAAVVAETSTIAISSSSPLPNKAKIAAPSMTLLATWLDVFDTPAIPASIPFWGVNGLIFCVKLPDQWFYATAWIEYVNWPSGRKKEAWLKGVTVFTYAPAGTTVYVKVLAASFAIIPADTTPYGVRVFDPTGQCTFDSRMQYQTLKAALQMPVRTDHSDSTVTDANITTAAYVACFGGPIRYILTSSTLYTLAGKNNAKNYADAWLFCKYTTGSISIRWYALYYTPAPSNDEVNARIGDLDSAFAKIPALVF